MPNPLARNGGLSYLHIPSRNPGESATFYERVLGWSIEMREGGAVRFASADGFLIGGFGSDEPGSGFVPWFYVDGIEAAVARVLSSGGSILEPLRTEANIRVVEIRDPGGNRLGLWEFS